MTRRLLRPVQYDAEIRSTLAQLTQDTTRLLIYATSGVWAAWQLYLGVTYAGWLGAATLPALGVVLATGAAALRLLPRGRVPALALWLAGLGGGMALNLRVIEQGEYAFLFALLPLLATLALGAVGGCAALAGLAGVRPWLMARLPDAAEPAPYGVYIMVGGLEIVEGVDVIRNWTLPRIGIALDVGHMHVLEAGRHSLVSHGGLGAVIRHLNGALRHIHVHDVRAGLDHCEVGAGSIRFQEIVTALREIGYADGLCLELNPDRVSPEGIRRSKAYLAARFLD